MYLGIVAKPIPERKFDGKIFLDRVARITEYKKITCNQQFTNDGTVNAILRDGDWHKLLADDMTLVDLRYSISEIYHPDNNITSRMVFRYYIPGKDGKKTAKYIINEDEFLPDAKRLKSQHTLMVRYLARLAQT